MCLLRQRAEVHCRREEGQQAPEEDELDRPAADEARARPDIRLGPACHVGRGVERDEEGLSGPAELIEVLLVERDDGVAGCLRRPVACGAEGDGGSALANERRLAVQTEGEREIDQLREGVRPQRRRLRLLLDARFGGGQKRGDRGTRRCLPVKWRCRGSPPSDRIEVDDRGQPVPVRPVACELRRPERSEDVSVRGDEHDRVREGGTSGVPCELEQRTGARCVVVGAG